MSSFRQQTGKTIQRSFRNFHNRHPKVYRMIYQEARKAVHAGKSKISIKYIIGWVRWEVFMITDDVTLFDSEGTERKFRLNDAYSSRYARMLLKNHPRLFKNKFEMRRLRS